MMNSKNLFWMLAALTLLLSGCGGRNRVGGPPTAATPDAVATPEADVSEEPTAPPPALTVLAEGEIRNGRPTLPLSFETGGTLTALNVEVGETVAAGDVIATLDDTALREAVTSAELRVAQSENSLLKVQGELDLLLTWEPDASAVAIAEANIASAEANLRNARSQDAAAGSSLTSSTISVDQAERELADAQLDYDNAFSPGREWEVFYDVPICDPGEPEPCQGITWAQRIKNDREIATTRLQRAKEQLEIAQANLSVEQARVTGNSAVGAQSSLVSAQEELARALKGPTEAEIAAARLNVAQAELVLEGDRFALEQAQAALAQAELIAPWAGTVLAVAVTEGTRVGAGTTIVTLLDTAALEFHTTNLSERDLDQIAVGQRARVTLKSYPNEPIDGRVVRIELQASGTIGDAAVFPVVIALEKTDNVIRTGMTGQVEILREE